MHYLRPGVGSGGGIVSEDIIKICGAVDPIGCCRERIGPVQQDPIGGRNIGYIQIGDGWNAKSLPIDVVVGILLERLTTESTSPVIEIDNAIIHGFGNVAGSAPGIGWEYSTIDIEGLAIVDPD